MELIYADYLFIPYYQCAWKEDKILGKSN